MTTWRYLVSSSAMIAPTPLRFGLTTYQCIDLHSNASPANVSTCRHIAALPTHSCAVMPLDVGIHFCVVNSHYGASATPSLLHSLRIDAAYLLPHVYCKETHLRDIHHRAMYRLA
ncbi:hypothetical protein [Trueperella sp. LYQ143]|uniref:hypothetical protein n=1 Tax=Trueperella sp. LYQ143 TaxID=3391059 RepID=UPI0039834AA9